MTTPQKPIITEEDVRKIARLARLKVNNEEVSKHAASLTHILEMITHIHDQDTQNVTAMSSSLNVSLALREDRVTDSDQHQKLQKLAPQTESGFYLVPPVIE